MTSFAADVLRPFWVPSLHNIAGPLERGIGGWICTESYLVNLPVASNQVVLSVTDSGSLLEAIAFDCTRLASAAFETQIQAEPTGMPPKALSWRMIKAYYSAFFAAHSIMRTFGEGCSHVDGEQLNSLRRIAAACGAVGPLSLPRGYYRFSLDPLRNELRCRKINISNAGAHEAFWYEFSDFVKDLSNKVLTTGPRIHAQAVHAKLQELVNCLCYANCTRASWLSMMRNEINYRHRFGVWFPYKGKKKNHEIIQRTQRLWTKDPLQVQLAISVSDEVVGMHAVCQFLVGLCRELVEDMYRRFSSPSGKSFHHYAAAGYLRFHARVAGCES